MIVDTYQFEIDFVLPEGAPPCCCGEAGEDCCCDDLADVLYAKVDHYISGPPPLYLPEIQTDYFEFTAVTVGDDCVCDPDPDLDCYHKSWHGSFPENYVWLPFCDVHIVMKCVDSGSTSSKIFRFGIDKYYGANCEYHAPPGMCDECSTGNIGCPIDEIHIGPSTSCGSIHEMWIKDTPYGD